MLTLVSIARSPNPEYRYVLFEKILSILNLEFSANKNKNEDRRGESRVKKTII